MTTIEDAKYCPKCNQQGTVISTTNGPRGSKVHVIHCQNKVCPWLDTGWVVQVKSDGTVAERQQGPKQFEALTNTDKAIAEKVIREVSNGQ